MQANHVKGSIRVKLLGGLYAVQVLLTVIFAAILIVSFRQRLSSDALRSVQKSQGVYDLILKSDTKMLSAALDAFLSSGTAPQLYAEHADRKKLLSAVKDLYGTNRSRYGITHFYFIDKDGTCFLRVHQPEQFGDAITRKTFLRARSTGATAAGIELGKTVFALRVVTPFVREGRLVGYVEMGEEIDHFDALVKQETGVDVAVLIDKRFLQEAEYRAMRKASGQSDDWDELQAYVLASSTVRDRKLLASSLPVDGARTIAEPEYLGTVANDQHRLARGAFPLKDATGKQVGVVLVLTDVTEQIRGELWTLVALVLAAVVTLLITFGVAARFLRAQIIGPLVALSEHAVEITMGNVDKKLDVEAGGEVGELARAFRSMTVALADRDQHLRERNRDLQQVLDSVGQGFLAMDRGGAMSPMRSAVVDQWFGTPPPAAPVWAYLGSGDEEVSRLLQHGWASLFDPATPQATSLPRMPRRLQRGDRTLELEYRLIEGGGRTERVVLVISDVTTALAREHSERQLQAELQQAQKLEAVGRLAAGIAHEINTPIQYIGDNAHFLGEAFATVATVHRRYREVLAQRCPEEVQAALELAEQDLDVAYFLEEMPKAIARSLEGVRRVSTIVRAMKEFAHPDQNERVSVDLNRSLQATLEVARNEYKYVADIETDFGEIPAVSCVAGDLNQVFLNVIVNAAHGIESVVSGTRQRGTIRVTTRRDGVAVVVAIADTGCGIPEAIRDKVFDPFFTTKPVGKGTGQGLAIARSIVKKHGGHLSFTSEVGAGTTFSIRLPVAAS